MGVETYTLKKVKCCNCKKKKIGKFKVIEDEFYCEECYKNLGGDEFRKELRDLSKYLESKQCLV